MAIGLDGAPVAFALVIGAGLSTALGAMTVFVQRVVKLASQRVLGAGLGFSAGVMLYVSLIEIFGKSVLAYVADGKTYKDAYVYASLTFFAGMALMAFISFVVHLLDPSNAHHGDDQILQAPTTVESETPDFNVDIEIPGESTCANCIEVDSKDVEVASKHTAKSKEIAEQREAAKLKLMGLNTAAAIAIHNFPEGLATFVAALDDPHVGVTLAIAIGIHNIPEGLCVALPIYYATGSRCKAFFWAMISGVSEPIGALIGYLIIKASGDSMSHLVFAILFGLVAGMMVMIVISELLPTAYKYDPTHRLVTNCVVFGMGIMAASLCLFQS